eukprot:1204698-Pyramimonas_sp.AAC.1
MVDEDGILIRGLYARPPFILPQTAISGEHAGAVLACVFSADGLESPELFVDCQALLGRPAHVLGPECSQGHFWRAMSRVAGPERLVSFVHGKAHRDDPQAA